MNQPKRYLDIVHDIRDMIRNDKIRVGDRIPSERELAERLQVGRSTIREALRSLELLGLIETRRGEGTFLSNHRNHQLVEMLSTFILQDNQSIRDVEETRLMHELSAIKNVCRHESLGKLRVWDSFRQRLIDENRFQREDFVKELMVLSGNRLSLKIWMLLEQFDGKPFQGIVGQQEKEMLLRILEAIEKQEKEQAIQGYMAWCDFLRKGSEERNGDHP